MPERFVVRSQMRLASAVPGKLSGSSSSYYPQWVLSVFMCTSFSQRLSIPFTTSLETCISVVCLIGQGGACVVSGPLPGTCVLQIKFQKD